MKNIYEAYIIELFEDSPWFIYLILFCLLLLSSIIFFSEFEPKKALRLFSRFTLAEYLFLIYGSTVFFRSTKEYIEPNLTPFWTYKTYDNMGRLYLLPEIIMNVVVFIPLGCLLSFSFKNNKWWQAMLIGCLISISIESLQYYFKLGMAEFDDVFHNTLGVLIGYILYKIMYLLSRNKSINS